MKTTPNEVYLTTGEFARLCKVNKRTLFHYDEIDLLKPVYTNEKGYRYYSHRQLDVFLIIHILKELKMPLKDIRYYLDHRTAEQLIEIADKEMLHIEQEITKLRQIQRVLQETVDFTAKGLSAKHGEICIEEQPEEKLIRSEMLIDDNQHNSYLEWTNRFREFDHFTQSVASSFVGTMMDTRELLSGEQQTAYFFVKTDSIHTDLQTFTKPRGRYAVAFHHGTYDTLDTTYTRLQNFIEQQHLQPGEYVYEEYLIDEVAVTSEEDYVTRITVEVINHG